jgi:hypothetical protein
MAAERSELSQRGTEPAADTSAHNEGGFLVRIVLFENFVRSIYQNGFVALVVG